MERIGHYIGGKHIPGESGRTGPVFDPATGEQTHEVDFADAGEVGKAVDAAREAFPAWRATSLSKRADIMFRIRELIEARKTDIAKVLTSQHGKVLSDAVGEVQRGLENVEYATGIPNLLKGEYSEQVSTGIDVYSIRQPLGVVAGITPFNFPAMVPIWMCANAMACGNTFVLKPSEKDPGCLAGAGRAVRGRRAARRRVQHRAGRQGRGRRDPRAPGHPGGELRRLDADRQATSTRRARRTGSASRRSAARRTT